ncbi:MAG: class I SAM-dependent methyltransferase [Myxococcales bacterium]|nr:class I SAM-dependent methyltransferase [Myxococcales bacterium]
MLSRFLQTTHPSISILEKLRLVWAFVHITNQVRAYHSQAELLEVTSAILERGGRNGVTVVEAGAGKGASTAKLSLAVRAAGGGVLHVFDSFRGIPCNNEIHHDMNGRTIRFRKGAFTGRLRSVQRTVEKYGAPEVCCYHRGWFEDTMPKFEASVDVALFDVDLLSSTRTCLRYIYPRMVKGGMIFSQDGHLRSIIKLLEERAYWWDQFGVPSPRIDGLGEDKLLRVFC